MIRRATRIALDRASKTVAHGMLYTTTVIDYYAALADAGGKKSPDQGKIISSVELAVVFTAEDGSGKGGVGQVGQSVRVPSIGPRGPPGVARILDLDLRLDSGAADNYALAITNTPLEALNDTWEPMPHPKPPGPPLEQHARVHSTALCGTPVKSHPMPSLWPGTPLKSRKNSRQIGVTGSDGLVYAPSKKLVENIAEAIKNVI